VCILFLNKRSKGSPVHWTPLECLSMIMFYLFLHLVHRVRTALSTCGVWRYWKQRLVKFILQTKWNWKGIHYQITFTVGHSLSRPSIRHKNVQQKTTSGLLPSSWKRTGLISDSRNPQRTSLQNTTSALLPPQRKRLKSIRPASTVLIRRVYASEGLRRHKSGEVSSVVFDGLPTWYLIVGGAVS